MRLLRRFFWLRSKQYGEFKISFFGIKTLGVLMILYVAFSVIIGTIDL